MTKHYPYKVRLSDGQREKLAKVVQNNSAITIRLASNELTGDNEMMLSKRQINKLKKAESLRKGSGIKISKTQIRRSV